MTPSWEVPHSKSAAENSCGGNRAFKLVVQSHGPKPELQLISSQMVKMTKTKKSNPKIMGTSSQSRKKRMTRHLTARSRWTGSLTSSISGQTIVRHRAPISTKRVFTNQLDSAFGILETLDCDGGQQMRQYRLKYLHSPRIDRLTTKEQDRAGGPKLNDESQTRSG